MINIRRQKIIYQLEHEYVCDNAFSEFGESFDIAKNILVVGAPAYRERGKDVKGSVFVYTNGTLDAQILMVPTFSGLGAAVTVSPNGYRIATLTRERNRSTVLIFRKKEIWTLEGVIPLAEGSTSRCSLFFSADSTRLHIVQPSYKYDESARIWIGMIYVYRLAGTKWKAETTITEEGVPELGWFSSRLDMTTLLLSSREGDKLYTYDTDTKSLKLLKQFEKKAWRHYFHVTDDWLVVSYPLQMKSTTNEVGEVHIYRREGSNYIPYTTLTDANIGFGSCVHIHKNYLLVGSPNYYAHGFHNLGAIIVYDLSQSQVTPIQLIVVPKLGRSALFGAWFKQHGNTLYVATPFVRNWSGAVLKFRYVGNANQTK
jgi:hypothetical protein